MAKTKPEKIESRPARVRIVIALILAVALGAGADPSAFAWSSKEFPLFEPIHQMAIDNVLKAPLITDVNRQSLKDQQIVVDQDQDASQAAEHAMAGIEHAGETLAIEKPLFIGKAEELVHGNLLKAIDCRKHGDDACAMKALGSVIHALEDATSPAHHGFQPWNYDEGWWASAEHVSMERSYPDASGVDGYRARLEGSVRYAYDLYVEKADLPEKFFDAEGELQLPPLYLSP